MYFVPSWLVLFLCLTASCIVGVALVSGVSDKRGKALEIASIFLGLCILAGMLVLLFDAISERECDVLKTSPIVVSYKGVPVMLEGDISGIAEGDKVVVHYSSRNQAFTLVKLVKYAK